MPIDPHSRAARTALLRRRARGGNSKVNLLILIVVLIVAGGYLYVTKFKPLTDDQLRAVILKRANTVATNCANTLEMRVSNLQLSNAPEGSPVPKVVEITGDLTAKDPKGDKGTIKGTYDTANLTMHLDLSFAEGGRELDNLYGSDRD
jgi:hypothetical protein